MTKAEGLRVVGWGREAELVFKVVTSRKAPSQSQCPMGESTVKRTWYKKS